MNRLISAIKYLRDRGVKDIIESAKQTAKTIEIDTDFPVKRKRKVKRMMFDEVEDDGIFITPEQDFVIQCNCVFDSIITQMEWRFKAMSKVSSDFQFLTGKQISPSSVEELK